MKLQSILAVGALSLSLSSFANGSIDVGPVNVNADISGGADYIEDGDATVRDAYLLLDASVTENIGLVYQQGIVRKALEDIDADDLDIRNAYVYVNIGRFLSLGEIELKIGKQALAFGEDVTSNAIDDTATSENDRERFRAREAVTISLDRDTMSGKSLVAILNNFATRVEVSSYKDQDDGLESGQSIKVSGGLGSVVDTSISYLDDKNGDATNMTAKLKLDQLLKTRMVGGMEFTVSSTDSDLYDIEEKSTTFGVSKRFGKHKISVENEKKKTTAFGAESEEKINTVSYNFFPAQSRWVLGAQVQKDDDGDLVGALSVDYNLH